jgi:hypothetical protein
MVRATAASIFCSGRASRVDIAAGIVVSGRIAEVPLEEVAKISN